MVGSKVKRRYIHYNVTTTISSVAPRAAARSPCSEPRRECLASYNAQNDRQRAMFFPWAVFVVLSQHIGDGRAQVKASSMPTHIS